MTIAAFKIFFSRQGDGTVTMVSKELKETLDKYQIGDKLRSLRLRRKMGLVELGKHSGLSSALPNSNTISSIPRFRHSPASLWSLALVWNIFSLTISCAVLLRGQGKKSACAFPNGSGS